ncbi:subtilase-type protease inhibitor [Streptomyces sp. NBC_01216]|uniref:subtilase-type protease inhibitor n=1 Tax=unclassified Streptomyces TaxID=2593676 RepID=UPI002E102386|nr:subtilase-type protease inhibitor [Streptomyces sp. NBC_01216]
MRSLRSTLGATVVATATGVAFIGTALAGIADAKPAQPASLYPASAVVLTIGKGETAATAAVQRAVTLDCTPRPAGSHPTPVAGCAELAVAEGDFARLSAAPDHRPCTREWDPVTVTGDGVWEGRRVSWSATYGNACTMRADLTGTVFAF